MRINKYLALCGLGSRRGVEKLVLNGDVSVNGKKIVSLATDVAQVDEVMYREVPVSPNLFKYFAVYKPIGYVSTNNDPHAQKKISDLDSALEGLSIVGRLDKDSEGLVLLSNDGDFIYKHQHPSNLCQKEYIVETRLGEKTTSLELEKVMRYFTCGTRINGYRTRPAKIKLLGKEGRVATFNITLTEGRKRQIRETFAKERIEIVKLMRTRIGEYRLNTLLPGEIRQIEMLDIKK